MSRTLIETLFLTVSFVQINCDVYSDRPKIKTLNGDLILEPGRDKDIYLRTNGPKSSIFIGDIDLFNLTGAGGGATDDNEHRPSSAYDRYLNGPNGILNRLNNLEERNSAVPSDLLFNISMLWRRMNRVTTLITNLRNQVNERLKDECQSRPCANGGTCLNLATGYYCLCPTNWEGQNCNIDVNECRNFAGTDLGCQNGATCLNLPGTYECLCRSGWFGLHCTRKSKDCSGGNYEMCGHGTCIPVTTGEGITCICDQGWMTNGTGVTCLTDVNECESSQGPRCSVNPRVECVNLPGSFRCGQCPPGFEGDGYICSDIDECVTIPNGGCSTSPMVTCHNTIGSRICASCPPGYQGDGITCSWRGSCSINRGGCHPSAQCIDNPALGGQIAQCICPAGMEGDGIGLQGCYIPTGRNDTRNCESNPCGIHGQCHPLRTGYTCICYRGYGGAACDARADYCTSNPCLNGGSCRPDESSTRGFRCECTAQYSGDLCHVVAKNCGGLLQAEEGSIVYPLTNTTYNHNSRCAWVIQTDYDKVINVTFSKFNVETSPDCSYDFLQIHDGHNSASQIIGRFCGNEYPKGGNIVSSHNSLYFWFRSDTNVAKDGFALHWTSVKPICGGEVDATLHGHISSPGSPGKYPPNRDCYWHLTTSLGKRIQLHFFELDIESHVNCSNDYIAIYDGAHISDSLLSMNCNSTQPAPVESAGSDLLIHFHSDPYGSGNGFQIAFAPTEGVPSCGGFFTNDKGEIVSPTYEGKYMANLICEYKIKVDADSKIHIIFKSFKLESSFGCKLDYLKIYDGPSTNSRLVGRFCGNMYPKYYTSSSNTLYIKFKSDSSVSFEGFRLAYESVCQQTILGDSGVIKSPGYPFNYPASKVCEYIIGTSPGKAIQLTFQDFDIEDTRHLDCGYDSLEIRDGANLNATVLGRYCGSSENIPPVQTSTHNYMYLKFTSDLSVTGTGFYANFTTIDTECGGIYRDTTGLINHPTSGSTIYENDQSCVWMVIAPEGMHIKLTWNRFDLENMPSCSSDYLELIEIDDSNENNSLGKYCGTVAPPALTVSSNRIMLKFESDSSLRSNGFSVSYTFLDERSHCGGMYVKSHGFIYSPGWPNRYEINRDCTWTIRAPVGQQIKLNITQFDLERVGIRNICNYVDFLEIRNGIAATAPLLGKYCGTFQSKYVISTANVLFLHFHSDSYITGKGFKIEWDSTVTGCGGTLTSPSGSISSPNYPANYHDNAECFYRIVTSAGTRVHITFKDLELERTLNCRDDYVEIYDGRDEEATSLGRHCQMSPKLNSIQTRYNYAFIKFRSDFFIGGKGFLLEYDTMCENNMTGLHGAIESPGYPNNYPVNLNCLWVINVYKGNKINITFTHFDLNSNSFVLPNAPFRSIDMSGMRSCSSDYVQIKESSDINFGEKMCGTLLPPRFTSKTNSLQIKFYTNYLIQKTGFRLEWAQFGCGGYIQKRYGILSLDKSLTTGGEMECVWVLESQPGTSINIVITDLYMTDTVNCTTDGIEIYNGQSMATPLLAKICHRGLSRVQSTTNIMLIRFIKKSSLKDVFFTSRFDSFSTGCGGKISSRSGIIHSKNYPKNYEDNSDCIWTLTVPINYRIELNFMDLDLYTTSDESDCSDFIKIFNGVYSLEKNYTQLICPNTHATRIISKENSMGLQFITDGYGTAKGFKANFTITCGAIITAKYDGILTNDDKVINYLNTNCTWTIRAPSLDKKISLTITHMSIPKNTDIVTNRHCPSSFLRVFDGNDDSAPLVDEYCGRKVPPMIVSHGSAITIQLGAYNNSTVTGTFAAHYTTLSSACGGSLTSEEGTIASPNYPQSYPVSASCEWILSTSPGNRVYITFEQFDLDYSENCNEDYLEVRESDGAGLLLGLYCGNEVPINTTAASKLYIKFHSDNKNTGRGFLIHYGFIHGNEINGLESGEITSPLYPFKYEDVGEYTWRIVTNDTGTISLTITNLEIPTHGSACYNSLIVYDGYDADAPILKELCGLLTSSEVIQTSSNAAFIKFKLVENNSGSKFHILWAKENKNIETDPKAKMNCGFNETRLMSSGESVIINSPNYPNQYNDDLNCEWIFKSPRGYHVSLNFQDISLEQTPMCFADRISIYSSDNLVEWKPVKEGICLSDYVNQIMNSSSYMKITFRTDASITNKGFKATVTSMCGGVISESSGVVSPNWTDVQERRTIKCEWIVKVRPGRLIKLHFEHFNITSNIHEGCSTFVTLRNGGSAESPLLGNGKYCGNSHENMGEIRSSSNVIFVRYEYNYRGIARGFQNFRLRYEEENFECGVTSTLDADHKWELINSPNYPSVSVPYSECTWVFTGPPGEILRVDFLDRFDLDKSDDCTTEVVEIRDGSSDLSLSKGRFCNEKPGTIRTSNNMVYIKYLSQLAEPRNGFKANVSIDVCGGTIVGSSGELVSPGYPHMLMLPSGSVCEWRIIGMQSQVLKIKPQHISLPESNFQCGTSVTVAETMQIRVNNTLPILNTFCNDKQDEYDMSVIETSSNEAIITLNVGLPSQWPSSSESRGFRFTFNSSRQICRGFITTAEGYLTTPGYPRETTLRYCQWIITVPDKTRRVRLELLDFDTATHRIGIYNDINFQSVLQVLPSEDQSQTRIFESSGNELALHMWSNVQPIRQRFKAKFTSTEGALCGGSLSGISGELLSPAIERSYTCQWLYINDPQINTTEYKSLFITIKVNSSRAVRVVRSRCSYSDAKLIIRSDVTNSQFTRMFCGNIEKSFGIPSTTMELKATTSKLNSIYFHLEWKLQPCGGVVEVGVNPLNILNVPNNYNGTLDCIWLIVVPIDNRVELKLEGRFELDCANEYLQIGQGLSQYAPVIGEYCKDKIQDNPTVTPYRYMQVQYHSNAKNNTAIKLMAKAVTNQCGGFLTDHENVFASPNYLKSYSPNMECTWEIRSDASSRISLQFVERFVIEDQVNCTKDSVIVYDWKNDSYTEIARLCGRQLPPTFNSTSNRMKVVLRTDADINLEGFKAAWTSLCGGKFTATDKEQFIYSPGYPDHYSPSLDCTYVISSIKKINVKFYDLELEGTYPSCKFDNVSLSATSSYDYLQEVYCGMELPPPMHRFTEIRVNLKTDQYIQRRGFKMSYSVNACGGKVMEPTVLSSNPIGGYDNNLNCTWYIEAPLNKTVILTFEYIDLESISQCENDYIGVYNGLVIDKDKRLALMCGSLNTTTVLRSSANTMMIQFVTDVSLTYAGFKVKVLFSYSETVGCGGKIDMTSTSSYSLKSPLIGGNVVYENYLDCHWTVKAPIDYAVKIEFMAFHVSSCYGVNQTALGISKCDCDYVEIKDGINPNSIAIGSYCGHTLPPELISSTNLLSVRLVTDGIIASSGFEAMLTVQRATCGQSIYTVTKDKQRVTSPGYDVGSIVRGVHCVYHFDMMAQQYATMRLIIKNLDLRPGTPDDSQCNNDKLTITSVASVRNATFGGDYILNRERRLSFYDQTKFSENVFHSADHFVLCGGKKSLDFYLQGSVTVHLQTTAESDSKTYKGVEMEVVLSGFCGRNYTELQGRIKSSYDASPDISKNECYTLITAPEKYTISVYFISVQPEYWNENVYFDVYDGNSTSASKLLRISTQYQDNTQVFSTGRYVLLHHRHDDYDRLLYDLNYVASPHGRGCGGKLSNVLGRVTSPLYPAVYRQKGSCEWEIETPHGTRVRLHFATFDLGRACAQNYVQLLDRRGAVAGSYCAEAPADYTSADNYVRLVFTTTMNNGGTGWDAHFIAIL